MTQSAEPANVLESPAAPVGVAARVGAVVEWTLGILLIGVVAINVLGASGRYFLSYGIVGADELMVFVLIFVVMGGAVLALARRQHISINLLPSYARGRWRSALFVVHDLVALAATAYVAKASWSFVDRIAGLDTRSMALGLPMTIPHSAVFAGFAGMAIVALFCLLRDGRDLIVAAPDTAAEAGR